MTKNEYVYYAGRETWNFNFSEVEKDGYYWTSGGLGGAPGFGDFRIYKKGHGCLWTPGKWEDSILYACDREEDAEFLCKILSENPWAKPPSVNQKPD